MPLFEKGEDELIPFRRVQAGPDLYEEEIEDLLWQNLESFVGIPLFPVARQAQLGGGLIPDVIALDKQGHVLVIEVKRDVDRRQLAQCLEYAGWARNASLDELAGLFHGGAGQFFASWTEFTGSDSPILVSRPPHLVLVARDIDRRTESALTYLTENDLPVTVLRVTIYEDQDKRRFVDVDSDHEPDLPTEPVPDPTADPGGSETVLLDGKRVQLSDLLDAGLLTAGEALSWHRPRLGNTYAATVTENGAIRLSDGRTFAAPSRAAMEAADIPAYDGWLAWKTAAGKLLHDLRAELLARASDASASEGDHATGQDQPATPQPEGPPRA